MLGRAHFLVAFVLIVIVSAGVAHASGSMSMRAAVSFDTALLITKASDVNFGFVEASTAGTYTIDTSGHVTASNGGILLNSGSSSAGNLTVMGSTIQTIAIHTGSYITDHGVAPSAATCSYNGGAAVACDAGLTAQAAPGAGATLRLGLTVMSDGTAAAGTTARPTFTVTVVYS